MGYHESPSAVRERGHEYKRPFLESLFSSAFLMLYFSLLPVLLIVGINWVVYSLTMNNFYQDAWMMPVLMLLSTFLAGALMRQKMEDEDGGLGLFFLGMLALVIFSWMTHQDIETMGGVYSRFMPKLLRPGMDDYVFLLPAVGLVGMLFYKQFTLKNYS